MTDNDGHSRIRTSNVASRRRFLTLAGAAGTAGLAGCTQGQDGGQSGDGGGDHKSLHFTLSWVPKGQIAPMLLAQKKGFWADKNLSVQVSRGYGSAETAKAVGSGNTDLGFAGVTPVMEAISQGLDIVEVSAVLHQAPDAIISRPEVDPSRPEDLVGQKGVHLPGGASWALARAMFNQADIDYENEIDWIVLEGSQFKPVLAGEADFAMDWATNVPAFWFQDDPVVPNALLMSNYVDVYGNGIITQGEFLNNNRDAVRRFVEGIWEGYQYAMENGDDGVREAVDALLQFYPEMALAEGGKDFHLANAQLVLSLMLTETTKETGLGYFTDEKKQNTLDLVNEYLLDDALSPDQVFDSVVEEGDFPIPNFSQTVENNKMIFPGNHENPIGLPDV